MKKKFNPKYIEYLKSEKWKKKRLMALIHYGGKCAKCGYSKRLDVHHLTYKRFGKELLADLQLLCRKCHDEVHNIKPKNKRPSNEIRKPKKTPKVKYPRLPEPKKVAGKRGRRAKPPVGSTIVLRIKNPNPNSPHTLPARLRNKQTP